MLNRAPKKVTSILAVNVKEAFDNVDYGIPVRVIERIYLLLAARS